MLLEITVRHGQLSDASREKLTSKVDKLQRYFERLSAIEVIVDLEDESAPHVEMLVSAEHKHDFVSHGQRDNLWGSVDMALQKIEQQLRKYKEKVQTRHRNPEVRRSEPPIADEPDME